MVEAPRGTLIHNYWTDKDGIILRANIITATNNKVGAIDKSLLEASRQIFEGGAHLKMKFPKPMIRS